MTPLTKHKNYHDSLNIKIEKVLNFLKTQSKKYGLGEVIFDPETDPEIENIFKIKVPKNISFSFANIYWNNY